MSNKPETFEEWWDEFSSTEKYYNCGSAEERKEAFEAGRNSIVLPTLDRFVEIQHHTHGTETFYNCLIEEINKLNNLK